MAVKVKPLTIKVLKCDSILDIITTWIHSRPELLQLIKLDEEYKVKDLTNDSVYSLNDYFKKLLKQDSSFMYFADITLEIQGSLLLREFFYSFNFLGKWAKTNRHSLPENPCASSEAYSSKDDELFDIYNKRLADFHAGIEKDADIVKSSLPLSFQTPFEIKLSIKELMRIIGYAFNKFGVCNFTKELWSSITELNELTPFLSMIGKYSNYSDPQFPGEIKEISDKTYEECFGFIKYNSTIGYTLYSHLIRHEGLKIDGYISFMKDYLNGKSDRSSCASFNVSIITQSERWKEIIRIRTSWFALVRKFDDKNNWGWILKDFITGNLENDKEYLKYFKNGKFDSSLISSYSVDEDLKVRKGNIYQLPDAFALESRAIVEERIKLQGLNPLLKDYLEIFDNGFVMDNPNNELRRRYEQNNNSNGSIKR